MILSPLLAKRWHCRFRTATRCRASYKPCAASASKTIPKYPAIALDAVVSSDQSDHREPLRLFAKSRLLLVGSIEFFRTYASWINVDIRSGSSVQSNNFA